MKYYGNYSFYETEKEKRMELQIARYVNQQKRIKEVERQSEWAMIEADLTGSLAPSRLT